MMKFLLWPGDAVASMVGLPEGSDNRQILRMWTNTTVWGALSALVLVLVLA